MLRAMRGLWLESKALSYRDDLPAPTLAPGEARVRVRLAGICGTDLELVRGYYPYRGVPGHELVGEVIELADDVEDRTLLGARVVCEINAACGTCPSCAALRPTHCEQRTVLGIVGRDGAFAEELALPARNLHRVPDAVPDDKAVFCEPLAAALEIQQQLHVRPSDRVVVLGAGRFGQLIVETLSLTGCDLSVVARREAARAALRARGFDAVDAVEPARADIVVDVSGAAEGFALARAAVRPRGTLLLKTTCAGRTEVDMAALVVDEITVVGSRCGPFAPALRLLERGVIDPRRLIVERLPLSSGVEAFARAAEPGVLKVLLEP